MHNVFEQYYQPNECVFEFADVKKQTEEESTPFSSSLRLLYSGYYFQIH